jgi:hypothetical protein
MTQKKEGQSGKPEDIAVEYFDERGGLEHADGRDDGLEPGTNPDAEAMVVFLKKTTHEIGRASCRERV